MKYCMNCGKEMADNEMFCSQCGTGAQGTVPNYVQNDLGLQGSLQGETPMPVEEPPVYLSNGGPDYQANVPRQKFLGDAITSFACGVVGLFLFPIVFGIAAIVVSITSMRKIKANPQPGNGFAIAGLVLGIVDLIWYVISVAIRVGF